MKNSPEWVKIGRFGRTHGIKGCIIVHSFTDPSDRIKEYKQWYAFINQQWRPIKLKKINVNSKHILAQIEEYETQEQVAVLTNIDIAVPRDELPPLADGEYYWHELIGMNVVNLAGQEFGQVDSIMATGSNDVLVVEGKEKKHLIPYLIDQFVIKIDKENRLILVDWDIDF